MHALFPGEALSWGHVNLEAAARRLGRLDEGPLPIPEQQALVAKELKRIGVDAGYGGWLENRNTLWRDTYLQEEEKWVHLGVDFYVPQGTLVASPFAARVIYVGEDPDTDGGWGTRILLQPRGQEPLMILGHLQWPSVEAGCVVQAGQQLGTVGEPARNGGWFPHLHVQAVSGPLAGAPMATLLEIDGYGKLADLNKLALQFPDPLPWLMR